MTDNKTVTFDAQRSAFDAAYLDLTKGLISNRDFWDMAQQAALAAAPTPAAQSAGQEAVAWAVYWGVVGKRLSWPPYSTKEDAERAAAQIKSDTEVRPLYAAPVNGGTHGLWDVYAFGKWQRRVSAPVAWDAHTVYLDMVKNGWSKDIELRGVSSANYSAPVNASEALAANFACYLIDHCEGETVTEEGVQRWLTAMLPNPQYAAPVNGGERECTCHPDDRPDECKSRYAASECQRAADAPQVGGDDRPVLAPLVEPVTVKKAMLAGRKARAVLSGGTGPVAAVHLVNIGVTGWVHTAETAEAYANGFNRGANWMQSALTSPAKVGGDEREVLIQSLKNAQEWIAASRDRCDEIERGRWDALQRVIDFLDRAALSADGGEDKRDADTLVRVLEMCKQHKIVQGDDYQLGAHQLAVKIDAVIRAANQAKGDAS